LHMLCCTHQLFFLLNYRKTKTPLTPWDNSKKIKIKKPKMPLDLGEKKVDLGVMQWLYCTRKGENPKTSLRH
jgi:hypothetical protein